MIYLRVEWPPLSVDQRLRQFQQLAFGLVIGDLPEIALSFLHLVGVAQRFQNHAPPRWLQADHIFAPPERQLSQPDLAGSLQGLAQHDERLVRQIIGGHHEERLLIIEQVDCVRVDELRQFQRLLALQLERVDLVPVLQHIFALA